MLNNIYILGTHTLSQSYFEKINNAKAQGSLNFKHCEMIPDPYSDFILNYFQKNKNTNLNDTLVPDHTAKHVLLQVFLDITKKYFPNLTTEPVAFKSDFMTPFLHKSADESVWAMSYATWTCPPDCDEPKICPHIKDTRTWDFNESLEKLFASLPNDTHAYQFSCSPLVEEIVHIPMHEICTKISDYLQRVPGRNQSQKLPGTFRDQKVQSLKIIVATHSHCHGILGQFGVKR